MPGKGGKNPPFSATLMGVFRLGATEFGNFIGL